MSRSDRPSTRFGVVLLGGFLLLAGCGDEEGRVEVAGPDLMGMGADQVMVGLTHNMTREGVLQGELRADTAYIFSDNSTVHLRSVDVTFYDDRGLPDSHLAADSGQYNLQTGDMEAHGHVVVRDTAEGQRLETPRLIYEALSNDLSTDTTFVWRRGGEVVRGTGLVTDPSFSDVRIEQPSGTRPSTPSPGSGAPPRPDSAPGGIDTATAAPPPVGIDDTAATADTASAAAGGG